MDNAVLPAHNSTRRRLVELFLGGGLLASLASFIYPLVRYLVPPPVADLGGDEVVAAKVGELKPNNGMIFRFGSRPGLLILTSDGQYHAVSATFTRSGALATTGSMT
jgi:cytochrome b6-f complex iron-sulfur subunit